MRWDAHPLVREAATSGLLGLAISGLFAWLGGAPFPLSLGVLLLCGPVTDLVLARIRARNPRAPQPARAPRWLRWAFVGWAAIVAVVAVAASHWLHVTYWRAFAVAWLLAASAGAVNAVVAEWEDNAPGGFLNPRP